jgi:opacity protein-like surface antigen
MLRSACAATLAFALAAPASAQDLTLYLDAGPTFPQNPPEFADFWNIGPSLGVGLGTRLSPLWEIVGSVHWQHFPADEAAQIGDLLLQGFGQTLAIRSLDGRDATSLTLMAEARFHVPTDGRLLPYLAFGWGFFELYTSDAKVTPDDDAFAPVTVLGDTDGAFGVTVGGGLELPVSHGTRLLLDSTYTVGFTDLISTQYLPLRLGVGFAL